MGKDSPPPPPDPATTAAAQGALNKETALFNTNLNRANQYGPDGSVEWTLRPGADPNNPQPGDYTQTTSLSPEQQALKAGQNALSQNLMGVAGDSINRVGDMMGSQFDMSGVHDLQYAPGVVQNARAGLPNSTISTQGLQGLNSGTEAGRDQVIQAIMSRNQPDLDRARHAEEQKLLQSGMERGTEGWQTSQDQLGRNENDAHMAAILAGGQEQSRLAGLESSIRGQQFGERGQVAGFENQTADKNFSQQNTLDTQLNALLGRNVGLNNDTRQQAISQEAYLRSLPLNEINALRTGSQVSAPQFGSYYTGGNAGAADLMGATDSAYKANQANTASGNAQSAENAAMAMSVAAMFF